MSAQVHRLFDDSPVSRRSSSASMASRMKSERFSFGRRTASMRASVPLAQTFEHAFHQIFARHRLAGEWFDMHPVRALEGLIVDITSGLNHFIGYDQELYRHALECSGVNEAEQLLADIKAYAASVGSSSETLQ